MFTPFHNDVQLFLMYGWQALAVDEIAREAPRGFHRPLGRGRRCDSLRRALRPARCYIGRCTWDPGWSIC